MFPVRFPSMICQWNMSWDRDYYSQDAQAPPLLPDWEGMGPLRGAPFHLPSVTGGWACRPSVRWLPLGRKPGGGRDTQGERKNHRDGRQHRAEGPTLLGRIQEVSGVSDAGVNGLQQSHEVLLAPRKTHE